MLHSYEKYFANSVDLIVCNTNFNYRFLIIIGKCQLDTQNAKKQKKQNRRQKMPQNSGNVTNTIWIH